jgi:archaellum component FlaG (FlaF/FlaG flagellin family)
MGFDLTATTVIFFIASVIVASAVSGVFISVSNKIDKSLSEKLDNMKEQIDTEFMIINDNEEIPIETGYYLFYLKNIGDNDLFTTNETFQILIDGIILSKTSYYFSAEYIQPGEIATINVDTGVIPPGDHNLIVVGAVGIKKEFIFKI